jgi:hypothetical protein
MALVRTHLERRLGNARRLDSTPQDILVRRQVVRGGHAVDRVEIVDRAIVELELAGAADGFLYAGVYTGVSSVRAPGGKSNKARTPPKATEGIGEVAGEDICLNLGREREDLCAAGIVLRGERNVELRHRLENGAFEESLAYKPRATGN